MTVRSKQKYVVIWLGAATAIGFTVWLLVRRRAKKNTKSSSRKSIDLDMDGTVALTTELQGDFIKAVEAAKSLTHLQNGDKLMLYGLYKQATVGNVDSKQEPSRFQVIEHAKYEAWSKFEDMSLSKPQAMQLYVDAIASFQSGDDMEYETEELDMFNAMGAKPSTLLANGDEDEKEDQATHTVAQQLRQAAREGNLDVLQSILQKDDANGMLDQADDSGQTALHFAADRGFLQGVELLVESGADVNAVDHDGISVLQAAVISGHSPIAALLIQNGANPDLPDHDGDTPRTCAHDDGSSQMLQLFTEMPILDNE